MGWRFRKSFKVIPGLRLNLSRSGLSASIGGTPFTLNVGPRGLMGTASIPGRGVSYRHHFDSSPHADDPTVLPAGFDVPGAIPKSSPIEPNSSACTVPPRATAPPIEEVRSASTELLTSESLKELKKLMQTTFEEREDIGSQLNIARPEQQHALSRYESWERGFLFKRVFRRSFAKRRAESETAIAKVGELEEQLFISKDF